jgi:hypothetical protein
MRIHNPYTDAMALFCCLTSIHAGHSAEIDAAAPPLRALTKGPKFHWFGYYDKLQFDPTQRYVLGMETDFQGRSPTADDVIEIGMIDLMDGDRWIELGESHSWSWQQGCMLQWRPGSKSEVLWNDREKDRFVCRILNTETGEKRTIPHPIYTISPDGRTAVSPDFRRIQDMRPGYGYPGIADPHKDVLAPKDSGIFRIDMQTGRLELLISLADVAAIPYEQDDLSDAKHYFNHLLFSPNGRRFIFLHRWRKPGVEGFATRMLTASIDGSDIRVVDPYGKTSHFIWRDSDHILAWAWHPSDKNAFYLYEDSSVDKVRTVGKVVMTRNGHCTYLPGNEWILNDMYPSKKGRLQQVYLYHVSSGKKVEIGKFHSPEAYKGEWRVDTHPRFSPDGSLVCIDSPHGGDGRQLYLIEIGELIRKEPG